MAAKQSIAGNAAADIGNFFAGLIKGGKHSESLDALESQGNVEEKAEAEAENAEEKKNDGAQ